MVYYNVVLTSEVCMKRLVMVLVILMIWGMNVEARDDFQYWQQMNIKAFKYKNFEFGAFAENRFVNDANKLSLYYISPRVVYHANKNLDLGLNYTYLQSRKTASSAIDDSYNLTHRLEFEINPQWQMAQWLKLKLRNRLELRWIEDQEGDLSRYRQRWTFEVPIKHAGYLKTFYTSNELFYEIRKHNFTEDQIVPFGLGFKLNDHVGLNLYYMVVSVRGARDWYSSQVVGSMLNVSF